MRLTAHFTLAEMEKSSTALRNGFDNSANPEQIANGILLAHNVFEPIRAHYNISFSPSSWLRCPELEKLLCAKTIVRWLAKNAGKTVDDYLELKQHPKGEAGDIELIGIDNYDLAKYIQDTLDFDDLLLEFYTGEPSSGWVHVSYSEGENRRRVRTFNGSTMRDGLRK